MKRILLTLLVVAFALTLLASCASTPEKTEEAPSTGADVNVVLPDAPEKENEILGKEGNIKFTFIVTHNDGEKVQFNVETTKDNLADALLEGNIIKMSGESDIIVTEIDGEKAEGDASWLFYKDGALVEGIASTTIAEGDVFEAKYITNLFTPSTLSVADGDTFEAK